MPPVVIAGEGSCARLYHFTQLFYFPGKLFEFALFALLLDSTQEYPVDLCGYATLAGRNLVRQDVFGYLLQAGLDSW